MANTSSPTFGQVPNGFAEKGGLSAVNLWVNGSWLISDDISSNSPKISQDYAESA